MAPRPGQNVKLPNIIKEATLFRMTAESFLLIINTLVSLTVGLSARILYRILARKIASNNLHRSVSVSDFVFSFVSDQSRVELPCWKN